MHTNSHIVPPGGQGDARPTARESAAVANAKIISIIDHEVAAAMRLTAGPDFARSRAASAKPRRARQATHDIGFVAANLRHDINTLWPAADCATTSTPWPPPSTSCASI